MPTIRPDGGLPMYVHARASTSAAAEPIAAV
jgi:hypothetical protein